MSQTSRIRKIPVSEILSSFLTKYTPEISKNIEKKSNETNPYRMLLNKISINSKEGLFFTALYSDLIKHRLSEDEIKSAIYGGALMRIVDDIYDYGEEKKISDFIKFTKPIIQSTINGNFSNSKNSFIFEKYYPYSLDPKDPEGKIRQSLDKLSFYLYCSLIKTLENKPKQKTNLAICLQRIQKNPIAMK